MNESEQIGAQLDATHKIAREWLADQFPTFDITAADESALESVEAQLKEKGKAAVRVEPQTQILGTIDGEFLGFLNDCVADDRVSILKWVGKKITEIRAKKAGVEAERQVWLDQVAASYDRDIRRFENAVKGLVYRFTPMTQGYFDDVRAGCDGKKPSSGAIGLLTFKYVTSREKTEVDDPKAAVAWLKTLELEDAIRVEESVLVSAIPFEIKEALPPESGITFSPKGDLRFKLEVGE